MNNELLKQIPNKNYLLNVLKDSCPNKEILNFCIDCELETLREGILSGKTSEISENFLLNKISEKYHEIYQGSLTPVINATGVVLHTNLGRAPISEEIFEKVKRLVSGYSNLEYDLKKGKRGDRYHHAAEYLKILTGAEDALIVNNNAAAVFLILNTFAKNKNVLVSRGELIEIGGSFRIPEVMKNSGAKLKEVGTTNKTNIADYEENIDNKTAIIMKVHKSNYEIVGFSSSTSHKEIAKLANKYGLISYYDLGSGSMSDIFKKFCNEPTLKEIVADGIDIVSASGDKLIGSVQCGIILGRKKYIEKIKKNQLLRMLRVDKLTLGILQETFKIYLENNEQKITSLKLLNQNKEQLTRKAQRLKELVRYDKTEITETKTFIGGGSCPIKEIDSVGLKIYTEKPNLFEKKLRHFRIPVICRKNEDYILLDMMTVFDEEIKILAEAINWAKV